MDKFKSCPSCKEQSDQCLLCASYVVDGERIYYEKLKDYGATQDHELRFINRIQKHSTTAFFHNGKLYIPSRQGRSVPLAIGLQWEAWQEQQAEIDQLNEVLDERTKEWLEAIKLGTYFQEAAKPLKDKVDQLQSQINEMAEVGLSQESELNKKDEHAHNLYYENANLQTLVEEKDKRIESALYVLKGLKAENDLWGCDQVEVQIEILEKTLRGEHE